MMITSLVLVARCDGGEIGELSEPAARVVCWVGWKLADSLTLAVGVVDMIERLAACSSAATDAVLHKSPKTNQLSTSRAPCPLLCPLGPNAPSGGGEI